MKALPLPKLTRRRLIVLAIGLILVFWWWIGSDRAPREITYCLNGVNYETPQFKCLESKTLHIPRAYDGDGYQFNFSTPTADNWVYLKVAYPSMKPWQSIPWSERDKTQKIELQLRGIGRPMALFDTDAYFLGTPKATHRPDPLFGLDAYDKDGDLILLSFKLPRDIAIQCANGNYPMQPALGSCWTYSQTDWEMSLFYYDQQILLTQWSEVNAKVVALVNSFVATPESSKSN